MRNFIATLFFSQGVPMLAAGDEMGRTQGGNNNAYCQDNATSWLDWNPDEWQHRLFAFTARVIALRNRHPLFRRRTFFCGRGRARRDADVADIIWLNPDGGEMTDVEWSQSSARCLGAQLSGRGLAERDDHGEPVTDDDVLLLLNAHDDRIPFRLPDDGRDWTVAVDTSYAEGFPDAPAVASGAEYPLQGRSLVLLTRTRA